MHLYSRRAILSVIFGMFLLTLCADGCGRRRPRPNPDKTKPTIKCPADIDKIADDKQIYSTDVYWTEPQANDNRDGPVTPTRTGLGPGQVFYEGPTGITYTAKDRSGNYRTCSFTINIEVQRCPPWSDQTNGWRTCDPSHDMLRRTQCRFGCYKGFELVGSSTVTCISEGTWSERQQPYCKPITCDRLLEADDKTNITCSDGNNYRSICYYSCIEGFDIHSGINRARVCSADGTWTGHEPKCQDSLPPEFTDCPEVKIEYAESSKTSGRVVWNNPKFTDNDGNGGVTLTQMSGPMSGQELPVGEYNVRYVASDKENNTALCEFKVVLKQISCHTLYPKPYTYVTCPQGRRFGSICEFSCRNGTALNRPATVQCESETHGVVRYGRWSFGETQPACDLVSSCDKPGPPNNGALVCDTWAGGKYCQIQCREGYLIKHSADSLLTCGDLKGEWDQLGEDESLPDCNKATAIDIALDLWLEEYFYFDGDCTASSDEIKANFLDAIYGEIGDICSNAGCTVGDVEVHCGNFTDKKKRSAGSEIKIISNIKLNGGNQNIVTLMNTRTKILRKLTDHAGNFTIATSTGTANLQGVRLSQPEPKCQPGFYADNYTLTCVECMSGSYHDAVTNTCTKCPRGQYQPEHAQTSCLHCPHGKTTERIGAVDSGECVAACPPGFFSFNGIPPCSPCDKGAYSSDYGADDCTVCPGSKTTSVFDTQESASTDDCFDFDINFPGTNPTEQTTSVVTPLQQTITSFQLGVWIQCQSCNKIVQISDEAEHFKLEVVHDDHLSIILNGCKITTDFELNVGTTRWRHLHVSVNATKIALYVDDVIFNNISTCAYQAIDVTSSINVTIGADSFHGSLSELNIWNGSTDVRTRGTVCHEGQTGTILSWRQFQDAEGAFTISPSECDAYDNCLSNPCRGQGHCVDHMDAFTCICDNGFKGDTCQENINDCIDNSCENGAACQDGVAGYTCLCTGSYSGPFCEIKVVDGSWAKWESWGPCSVTCGEGTHTRTRGCSDPAPDNGGKYCEGDVTETSTCTMPDTCHNECSKDPPPPGHGIMNCSWTDDSETVRRCYPECDQGYAFDSDLFLDEIVCGPHTTYIWNIRNDLNPEALIPECTAETNADANVLVYPGEYEYLTSQAVADPMNVTDTIQGTVVAGVSEIACIKNGSCKLAKIEVTNVNTDTTRKKRDLTLVGFVLEISCRPVTSVRVCYDLLLDVKNQLDAIVNNTFTLSISVDHMTYDVIYNSTSASGRSECKPGTVPVSYFCIHCGPGSYQFESYCERCPAGTYQDIPGAVGGCKPCPGRWTTAGQQTRNETGCNIRLPDDNNKELMTVLVVVVCLIVAFMVLGVVICQRFKRGYVKRLTRIDVLPPVKKCDTNSNLKFAWQDFELYTVYNSVYPTTGTDIEMVSKSKMDAQ